MREKYQKSSGKGPTNKLFNLFRSDPTNVLTPTSEEDSPTASTNNNSPYNMSPLLKSPWLQNSAVIAPLRDEPSTGTGLIGSLIREQGHLYSLATSGELLYTGSDSKNIRVWKRLDEFSGFKAGSGLVKAIVISGERIFTGHQDGKIRIWKVSDKDCTAYKRVGTLPRLKDLIKSSINPSSYVQVRRHRNAVWLRHFDAVSCLAMDTDAGILYSGSWDKTMKVWRISDSKCLESVTAHDDAINTVAVGFDGFVFTGSAEGTVKVWRREWTGSRRERTEHVLVKILIRQESAVTALAVSVEAGVVYCGSSDGLVNYWERGRRLVHGGVLRGHKLAVLCLVTAGSLVISGSADRTIRVWRREVGGGAHTRLSVLTGHAGPIKCLAVGEESGGGPWGPRWVLYSGSLDKSVMVWHVSERMAETDMTKTPLHVHDDVAGIVGMRRWRV